MLETDWNGYMKVYWFTIVTMTTVGYGDMTPVTIPGRILSFIMCIWGVFLVSMMVLTLLQKLGLTEEEQLALKVYKILEIKEELKYTSTEIIKAMFAINLYFRVKENARPNMVSKWTHFLKKAVHEQKALKMYIY